MSEAGHNAIYSAAVNTTGARVKTRPATSASTTTEGIVPLGGGIVNATRGNVTGYTIPTYIDLIRGGFRMDYSVPYINVWMVLGSNPINDCSYDFLVDYNGSAGDPYDGADIWIQFYKCPYEGNQTFIYMWNGQTWNFCSQQPFSYTPLKDTLNFNNYTGSGLIDSFFDVYLEVNILIPSINEAIISGNDTLKYWIESYYYNYTFPYDFYEDRTDNGTVIAGIKPSQTITVSNELTQAGGYFTVNGTNFKPNSTVSLYFDGAFIDNVTADSIGYFTRDILVFDNLEKNNIILMARDEQGNVDAVYVNVEKSTIESGTTSPDSSTIESATTLTDSSTAESVTSETTTTSITSASSWVLTVLILSTLTMIISRRKSKRKIK
ncbi:MAG: hypothetical protein ACXADY_23385 [Candidatus Hodarchaeales archaeon]|jgi:hypothetical protein